MIEEWVSPPNVYLFHEALISPLSDNHHAETADGYDSDSTVVLLIGHRGEQQREISFENHDFTDSRNEQTFFSACTPGTLCFTDLKWCSDFKVLGFSKFLSISFLFYLTGKESNINSIFLGSFDSFYILRFINNIFVHRYTICIAILIAVNLRYVEASANKRDLWNIMLCIKWYHFRPIWKILWHFQLFRCFLIPHNFCVPFPLLVHFPNPSFNPFIFYLFPLCSTCSFV